MNFMCHDKISLVRKNMKIIYFDNNGYEVETSAA